MVQPFHLALPVHSLESSEEFYGKILELKKGRYSQKWIDWDFFGHQLVTHLSPQDIKKPAENEVDGKKVPASHFGVILKWEDFEKLAEKLKSKKVEFIIEPYIRFKGKVGEQATMFFLDYSQNALEFKAFKDESMIFASQEKITQDTYK